MDNSEPLPSHAPPLHSTEASQSLPPDTATNNVRSPLQTPVIISTGVLVITILFIVWQRVVLPATEVHRPTTEEIPIIIDVERRVNLTNWKFTQHRKTLLMFTSENCPDCDIQKPFHEEAVQRGKELGIPVISVRPPGQSDADFAAPHTRYSTARSFGIPYLPAMVLVSTVGTVQEARLGLMTNPERLDLLNRLGRTAVPSPINGEIAEELWHRLPRHDFQLIDIGAREESFNSRRPGSVNIPHDELDMRARGELDQSHSIVIDCTHIHPIWCDASRRTLRNQGFTSTVILNRGAHVPRGCVSH
jgi:hypothetical protein